MGGDRGDEEKKIESLTAKIIECIIRVHSEIGPGFDEAIYHNAMVIESAKQGLTFNSEHEIVIYYEGHPVGKHRLDLVYEDRVVVELKAVDELCKKHYSQLRSYLRATRLTNGLLVNFNDEMADFRRVEIRLSSPRSPLHLPDPLQKIPG